MLSAQDNEILTRVGPGTPMGNLLRRYWIPACLSSEVEEPDGAPARVRLLGEDLVAFRDTDGQTGLIEEFCPHRGASLFYGRNEQFGLRCAYHGWKFDVTGQCVDQRSELHPFAHRVKIISYPVHESGGIVWAYLGPAGTMTPFRDFGTDSLPAEEIAAAREIVHCCNWVQSMDGDVDTAHISNLHQFDAIDDVPDDGTDKPGVVYPMFSGEYTFALPAVEASHRSVVVTGAFGGGTPQIQLQTESPSNKIIIGDMTSDPEWAAYEMYYQTMLGLAGQRPGRPVRCRRLRDSFVNGYRKLFGLPPLSGSALTAAATVGHNAE